MIHTIACTNTINGITRRLAQTSLRGGVATRDFGKFRPVDKRNKKKSVKERQRQIKPFVEHDNPMQFDKQHLMQPTNYDGGMDKPGHLGKITEELLRELRSEREVKTDVEEKFRDFDYLTAEPGSLEDLVGERRALMGFESEEEKEAFIREIDEEIELERQNLLDLGNDDGNPRPIDETKVIDLENIPENYIGNW